MNKVLQGIGASHDSHPMQKERDFARPVLIAWPPEERLFPFDRAVPAGRPYLNARLEPIDDSYTRESHLGED